MAEVTTYKDYVDLANQEYNLTLQGATEDNLFTKISESGQRSQLARYYYNKTGLNISDSNRIVIAPKNGYMIQRLSYIDNDLIGGVKSGIQALNIDTSNAGEVVLRNKGSVGQIKLVYVFHSLAYALGIKIDVSKVDIFPVLNEALQNFEFLYFAPLNIARTITSANIDFIDVLFIAYNNRTYFDKVLLQSLTNAMYNAGWFTTSFNNITDVSQIKLNQSYYYLDNVYDKINKDYLIMLATDFILDRTKYVLSPNYESRVNRSELVAKATESINTILSNIDTYGIEHNQPYCFSISQINDADIQINILQSSSKNSNARYIFNNKINNNLLEGQIYYSYDVNNTIGQVTIQLNHYTYEYSNVTYDYKLRDYSDGSSLMYAGSSDYVRNVYNKRVYSNVGNHLERQTIDGITFIEGAILPSGIDSLETDYPLWAQKLEQWTVTAIEHLIEQETEALKNLFKIVDFLPLNIITGGVTYPEKKPGVPYEPIEVETYEVLLPEIIPPQRPNKVINTLTLIPDEDDTVEDPEDPKTYEPIIDPKHPEKYPPTNKYYYDIDVEINYPKDFIDPIGGSNDNPTEPPSKNNGNISIPPKNPTDSVTSSKLFTVYNPTADQIDALGGYLWGESIAGTLASIFTNPLNAIISLHCIYCEPDVIGTKEIRLGYLASGVSAKYVVSQYKEVDCGTIRIPEYYGDCRDYSPYTTINLFLPFIGFRPIKVDDVMGSELSIKYFVDVYTGTCLACVSVNKGGVIQLTYNFDGNCSVMLPLTSGSWANMTVGLATALTSMIVNPVAGALQLPNAVHNGISMSSQGQLGCNAGAMGRKKPYVVVTNTQAYDAVGYNELYGYPANILTKLSQLEGYTKVKEVHVENVNNATVDEKNEIERLLKSGVIIS